MTIQKTSESLFKIVIFNMRVTAESVISEMIPFFFILGNSQKDLYSVS